MSAAATAGAASAPVRPSEAATLKPGEGRSFALDAYRGLIMILLVSSGFGFAALRNHPRWSWLALQFDHVPWEGATFWDMVQPAFMFIVGVALPFAAARRLELGAGRRQLWGHVALRSLRLVLLSQVLMCVAANRLHFQLINVLSQIAFTYFLSFAIMQLKFRAQAAIAAAILAGHWLLFALLPGPDGAFSRTDNIGAVLDRAWLGRNYPGYYVTINFITSTVTTLFGVWAGGLLRSNWEPRMKLKILAGWAAACFAAGLILARFNPLVKRLWTSSFALYSAGWVLLMLLLIYWLTEVKGYRAFAWPLLIAGMNSIFIYSINETLRGWLNRSLAVFTGGFQFIGALAPVAQSCAVLLVMWGLCYWLYRHRIFFKL